MAADEGRPPEPEWLEFRGALAREDLALRLTSHPDADHFDFLDARSLPFDWRTVLGGRRVIGLRLAVVDSSPPMRLTRLSDFLTLRVLEVDIPAGLTLEDCEELARCANLEDLTIRSATVPPSPEMLRRLSGLKVRRLCLDNSGLDEKQIAVLGGMRFLRQLELAFSHLEGSNATPVALAGLIDRNDEWSALHLEAAPWTDSLLDRLSTKHRGLEQITVPHNNDLVTDTGVSFLVRLPHIRVVNLFGNSTSGKCVASLEKMMAIEHLGLNCDVDDEGLSRLARLPTLRGIDLRRYTGGRSGVRALAAITALETLQLRTRGYKILDDDVAQLDTTKVRSLALTGAGIMELPTLAGMRDLLVADFFNCQHLADAAVARMAELPRLRRLDLRMCRRVTAAGVSALVASVERPALALDFGGTENTAGILRALAVGKRTLSHVVVTGGDEFEEAMGALRSAHPECFVRRVEPR